MATAEHPVGMQKGETCQTKLALAQQKLGNLRQTVTQYQRRLKLQRGVIDAVLLLLAAIDTGRDVGQLGGEIAALRQAYEVAEGAAAPVLTKGEALGHALNLVNRQSVRVDGPEYALVRVRVNKRSERDGAANVSIEGLYGHQGSTWVRADALLPLTAERAG